MLKVYDTGRDYGLWKMTKGEGVRSDPDGIARAFFAVVYIISYYSIILEGACRYAKSNRT